MEFLQSIKAHLYDKTSSPLFGAFAASWVAFNYEFIFILSSNIPVHDRFDYISTFLYCDYTDYLFKGFLFPLVSSLLVLLLYPFPARKIYGYWKSEKIKQHNLRLNLEGKALISKKKESEIRKETAEIEIKYENELSKKDLKIQTLTDLINDLHATVDESNKTIRSLKENKTKVRVDKSLVKKIVESSVTEKDLTNEYGLDKNQIETLHLISENEGESIEFFTSSSPAHDQITKYNIDTLKQKNLVSMTNGRHRLTPDGRKLLVNSGYFK